MTLYFVIRLILCGALVWITRKELPPAIHRYLTFMAVYQAMPQFLWDSAWTHTVWLGLSVSQMILVWNASSELFHMQTRNRTFWYERAWVVASSAAVASAFVILSFRAAPENPLQVWTVVQQYARLGIFFGWSVVSVRFGILRPLARTGIEPLLVMWTAWLGAQAWMGMAGTAGIVWLFLPKSDSVYTIVGDSGMLIQVAAVIWAGMKIRSSEWTHANV